MTVSQVRAIGIPWYDREDYSRILSIMEDASLLPRSYDQWLQKAESVERAQKAQGMIAIRAIIDPSAFQAWCRARSLNVDAKARAMFASEVAFREVNKTH